MKLKKIIKSLERHRRAITYKVTRVNRELNIIETKLRSHIIKTSSEKAKKRTNSRLYDSSTQLAQEIIFKRGQAQDLNDILAKINSMQETVTRVYLCIHKRQILGGISRGIQKIDIADMERSAKESTDTLEHQVLFDNVNKVRKLNISADTTINALQEGDEKKQDQHQESASLELESVLREFEDEHTVTMQNTLKQQEMRVAKIKNALANQQQSLHG